MHPVGQDDTATTYRRFAERECDDSAIYRAWAGGVADDPQVLGLLEELPRRKRQPNLVLAAARWHGAEPGRDPSYDELRRVLLGDWDDVRATVMARATQTNEVGRCATMLPLLASLPEPLALLEVGASAGLTLLPDRFSYRWTTPEGEVALDPPDGPSAVVLRCVAEGGVPFPRRAPEVVWRSGLDLNPLDVRDDDAMAWLQTLVWPEHHERRARLAAAVALAREAPPTVVQGDLLVDLAALVDTAPTDATLVVMHSAVLAYVAAPERDRFVAEVTRLRGHWVSNEGQPVLPQVAAGPVPPGSAVGIAPFVLGLDGHAVAWAHGHGSAVRWR